MTHSIPRIQGKIGTIESDDEDNGKYVATIYATVMGGGKGEEMGTIGPFETEEIAKKELSKVCEKICKDIEIKMTGKSSGMYVDMKDNKTKKWGEDESRD